MATIPGGELSPTRYVPPGIKASKDSPFSKMAGVLYVKPKRGKWEIFTSWDQPITLPPYVDSMQNYTPPGIAKPCAVEMTTVATQLKLGTQASDVKALAPRKSTLNLGVGQMNTIYLDRELLRRGYYEGAFWQYGELNPFGDVAEMLWWTCGEVGNVSLDDLVATIELASYEELANRKIGGVYHILCQVGAEQDEEFGTKRCYNETLKDGPLRAAWTVNSVVQPGATKQVVTLQFGPTSIIGTSLHPLFAGHLGNGDLEFLEGGLNSLLKRPIRAGEILAQSGGITTVRVYPKISLPYVPEAGAQLNLVVGCNRTKGDCLFFGNLPNMRAQDLEGNSDLQRRYKVT